MLVFALVAGSIIFFFLVGYRLYGGLIDEKVVMPDDSNETPAHTHEEDTDYSPAKPPILFGHHFASIAGAGPIIGPIVALAAFGWVAVLGWILLGSTLIGAVHDYLALIVSERNNGASIADVAGKTMSPRAKFIFGAFIYITLILVVAVFGALGAKTLVGSPAMVIPTFMVIVLAVIFGVMVKKNLMPLWLATAIAVSLNLVFIVIGNSFPMDVRAIFGFDAAQAQLFWFVILMIYAGVASILPVEILLQPRDYISTYNLYGALGLGLLGLLVMRPEINAPAFTSFSSGKGPLWPMLFVLVACGAVSGFHSLVSGGTTSKQLNKETDAKPIAFGGMLLEGVLAMMTLLLVSTAFYWKMPEGVPGAMMFTDVVKNDGHIMVFGKGFGTVVSDMLPIIGFPIATLIGMITIKTFVLTSLDTATRITRFVVEETAGRKAPFLANKYVALLACLIPAFLFGYGGAYSSIWPMFGASNQLIAALALFVVSSYLIGVKSPTVYTLLPAIFMLITTMGALVWQAYGFLTAETPKLTLGITAIVLMILALVLAWEGYSVLVRNRSKSGVNQG